MGKILQFIKFNLVGLLVGLLNLFLLWAAIDLLHINYIVSNVATYLIACIISYFINLKFTFGGKKGNYASFVRYLIMRCAVIAIDSLMLFTLVDVLTWNVYVSKLLTLVVTTLLSFGYSRSLFKNKKHLWRDQA